MNKDTVQQLSKPTIALHWIVGLSIIGLLAMGLVMEDIKIDGIVPLHKSLGVLVLVFVIARVIWRLQNGWPKPVSQYKAYEQKLSRFIHWILILGTIAMPVSGICMSYFGGSNLDFFGLEIFGRNVDPADITKKLARDKEFGHFFHEMHEIAANIMIAAISLHVIGALKHHFIDKDATIKRMLGKKVV